MNTSSRLRITAAAVGALAVSVACSGTPTGADRTTTVPSTTTPAGSTSSEPAIDHPTGADDVVLRVMVDGGFVAPGAIFGRLPQVVVAGDGAVYFVGAQTEIYPQPLLPPLLVSHVAEGEIQALLAAARDARLFRPITYVPPTPMIADGPSTVVTIAANGRTYVHEAYALGLGGNESDPDRATLQEFVDLLAPLGNGTGQSASFVATEYAIRATAADETPSTDGVTPNEVAWPAGTGVELAGASTCAIVRRSTIGDLFDRATQITRFVEAGRKYVLIVRPRVPGDPGC